MKTVMLFVLAATAISVAVLSCEDAGSATYTVSGTVTCTTSRIAIGYPSDDKTVYLKIVDEGGDSNATALYSGQATFTSTGSTSYSISNVETGKYTGWAFIDMDGSGGPAPNTGDYVTNGGANFTVSGDTTVDLLDSVWTRI